MKAIVVNNQVIQIVEKPFYIKKNVENDCFTPSNEEDAIGVSTVKGLFNLPGHNEIEDADEAYIKDDDGLSYFNDVRVKADEAEENINMIEEAVTSVDMENDERISAIEQVLCDLDEANA